MKDLAATHKRYGSPRIHTVLRCEGTERLYQELTSMLNMVDAFPGGWRPPVVKVGCLFDVLQMTRRTRCRVYGFPLW